MNLYEIPADHQNVIIRLFKGGELIMPHLAESDISLLAAAVGIAGEAAELENAILPVRLVGDYNRAIHEVVDVENLLEELGDHLFFEGALRIAAGLHSLMLTSAGPDDLLASIDPMAIFPPAWASYSAYSPIELAARDTPRTLLLSHMISLHTVIAGNILDVVKKHVIHCKKLEWDKLRMLLQQDCWVMRQLVWLINGTEERIREGNIHKLVTGPNARHKAGVYTDAAHVARADKKEGE